jgi:glycosyltransferase involved in cell wall biosynthesis
MNILQVSTRAFGGGAGRVMYRLHQELKRQGHASSILARSRSIVDKDVHEIADTVDGPCSSSARLIDDLGRRVDAKLGIPFTCYRSTAYIPRSELFMRADIVNLHNLHGRFFNHRQLPAFSSRKPIVWTLHDMWALTGHCAYAYDCLRWQTRCFDCPLLKEPGRRIVQPAPTRIDLTRRLWQSKRHHFGRSTLHIITPSQWLRDLVAESYLSAAATVRHIPNGLDLGVFRPRDKVMARRALSVPQDASTILFVAERVAAERKGLRYLLDALQSMQEPERFALLTVGATGTLAEGLDRFRRRDLGTLDDESLMSLVYSAADVFVLPTLADNQPLVLLEAMACGTPMVAFNVGGVPEMVRHMETGYLARYKDASDLARGIQVLLEDHATRSRMGQQCREVAEAEYSLHLQAQRYLEVYEHAIEQHLLSG